MYEGWTKEDLISEINSLKKKKKFGLVWDEKPEEVVDLLKDNYPILIEDKTKKINSDDSKRNNILIEADNYHALTSLNYSHRNSIDFIYIDPPYNTGSKDWKYNNNFVDNEDPYRHSKWISFIYRRLRLAKNLLKDNGVICVTIDDYELPRLWLLMEEIYGEKNHLGTVIIRNNPKGRMTKRKFSLIHEYAVFFGKTKKSKIIRIPQDPEDKSHNYKKDENGQWYLPTNLRKQGVDSSAIDKKGNLSQRFYPIYYHPKKKEISVEKMEGCIEILPIDTKGEKRRWKANKEDIVKKFRSGEFQVKLTKKNGYQIYYKFRGGLGGRLPQSIWTDSHFSASDHGTRILDNILGEREQFQYPKAPEAVKECIKSVVDKKQGVILDFFAGSGTTAQAVMELNEADGGSRKFILCTNDDNGIAKEVCYKRVKNIIEGYKDFVGNKVRGLPENLNYYKVDFVKKAKTDKDKLILSKKMTDMILLKESVLKETFPKRRTNNSA
tara:strand:+ start:652 stop:2136 length:1485 start_codon:yes stop_codon:yes gene_type:complete